LSAEWDWGSEAQISDRGLGVWHRAPDHDVGRGGPVGGGIVDGGFDAHASYLPVLRAQDPIAFCDW